MRDGNLINQARTVILAAVCSLAVGSAASASIVESVLATDDGDIQWNGSAFTVNTTATTLTMVRSGGNNVRNGVMEFDMGFLPQGAILTSVSLRVTTSGLISNTSATAPLHVFAFSGDGEVTSADHQNVTSGTFMVTLNLPTGSGTPSGTLLDIPFGNVAALQSLLDDGATFLAVRMQTENFATIRVHSLESTTPNVVRPTLDVTYMVLPAPAAGVVLAGIFALPGSRRRG